MKTISSVVEHYIKKKPFLQSALAQGIINLTSLSRLIKPEIQEELGKDIRNGAIVMALKRLSDDLEFRATHKIIKVLKNIGEITVRSSLTDFTFLVSDTILEKQTALLEEVNKNKDVFYTSSRGVNELNIVVSNSLDSIIEEIFKEENGRGSNQNKGMLLCLPTKNLDFFNYFSIFEILYNNLSNHQNECNNFPEFKSKLRSYVMK